MQEEYRKFLSELIKKQMVILGPNLVLSKARKIDGLKIGDDGEVAAIGRDPLDTFKEISGYFNDLSGHIAQITLERLLEKYPGLKQEIASS